MQPLSENWREWPEPIKRQALARLRAKQYTSLTTPRVPEFRGANLDVQSYTGMEYMLAGPAETGKTWATLWRLNRLLSETPRAAGALLRKVAADIGPTVLVTYKKLVGLSGSRAIPYGGEKPEWFDYPNGARLYIGGIDRPGKVLSGERD